ncbi:MAG: DNA-3-methyladenine glycosylase [Deltaproteobacteria bacterium]|nr:DNA-3-methyladenine glycosylase [Deltaproteobacteria bacterium]
MPEPAVGRALRTSFFSRPTLEVARELLGTVLVSMVGGKVTAGMIVEVEAYHQDGDLASHTSIGRTSRNEVMFWEGGHCYVYFIYGMHHCVNVVTENSGTGAAVLIRAVEPLVGLEVMQRRRRLGSRYTPCELTAGPGKLCQALGINRSLLGHHFMTSPTVRIERYKNFRETSIACGPRIGISKSKELPWRLAIKDHPCLSRPI